MNGKRCALLAGVLVSVVILNGCGLTKPRYFIVMVNRTPRHIDGLAVYFDGKMAAAAGHAVPGCVASFGYVALPIPAEAEVRWDDQGVRHARKAKLQGIVPRNPGEANVYFIVEEDGSITVACVDYGDLNAQLAVTEGIKKYRETEASTKRKAGE